MTAYVILIDGSLIKRHGDQVIHADSNLSSKPKWTSKLDSAKEFLTARDAYDWAGCEAALKDARVVRGDSARLLNMEG